MEYIEKWFVYLHGRGEAHQNLLYRCIACRSLVTWNKIKTGNVCCGGRVSPAYPTLLERIRLFCLPWTV